jgi:acetyl esterase/lipase
MMMFRVFTLALLIAATGLAAEPAAEEPAWTKETFVYKTVGVTKIEADVYRRNGTLERPAIVWIHGGALIMGNRDGVPKNIVELARANNYVLISIEYR